MESLLREVASETPDPARAFRNLERLIQQSPEFIDGHRHAIVTVARLFAHSQFLADSCIADPSRLSDALGHFHVPVQKHDIRSRAADMIESIRDEQQTSLFKQRAMKLLRDLKKHYLLIITMRDIAGMTTLQECMSELSALSEAIVEYALEMSSTLMRRKFGLLRNNAFSVIGMGKMGSGELNYSSDIDIITVYLTEAGASTGILNQFGMRHNKISAREYYSILTETMSALIQTATEDGIAYRVDLRLRPNGQKGALSLDLPSYHAYYEAWGKTWERVALIRARPVAGDGVLGESFLRTIEPFVWKRSIDFNDIEEIRELKKKIDTIADINDIKRGYGGIREIEFFVQTFQLLFGGERKHLRAGFLVAILEELRRDGFLTVEEVKILTESYLLLRRIEHFLQMKDDMQTYTLPSETEEMRILSRKMNFEHERDFLTNLKVMRFKVRDMYHSLLGETESTCETLHDLIDELPDNAILDYLNFKGFIHPSDALKNIRHLREQVSTGKTLRERTLLRKVIPACLEGIMHTVRKDRALATFVSFMHRIGHHESYTDLLMQRNDTREAIIEIFASSSYLSLILLNTDNLEGIFEYPAARAGFRSSGEHLVEMLSRSADPLRTIREFKKVEELKYGMSYLMHHFDTYSFHHRLSMLADTIIRAVLSRLGALSHFAIIGLGGYGARDLSIGSDLDLLFISSRNELDRPNRARTIPENVAEEIIRFLTEYTDKGFAYKVDMRLRPDGSQGVLVQPMDGYQTYYHAAAQPWEIQSLLKARLIAGDMALLRRFFRLRKQVILRRGHEMSGHAMWQIRKRIVSEASKESSGFDIKNGPGGIKEIEFFVQYHQMKHAADKPDLIVHDTVSAFQRLKNYGILDGETADFLLQSYGFLKTVDTLLRLNEEDVVKADSELLDVMGRFLQMKSTDLLLKRIGDTRRQVYEIAQRYYEKE